MTWIQGKQVVVTGATSGIGRVVAQELVRRGAEVVLACRDAARGAAVADELGGGPPPTVRVLDLADQASVRAFVDRYRAGHDRLDVLVNNAGGLFPMRRTSVDGIELTFATNVLGQHLLTSELLDLLKRGQGRIVNVASTFGFGVDLDDLPFERRGYDGLTAYAQSKACDRMLTWALARRLTGTSVTCNAVAPGLVLDTELYRLLTPRAKQQLAQYGSRSIAAGADTVVWAASEEQVAAANGAFFEQRVQISCEFRDETTEERLWQVCERLTTRRTAEV
jgi:retinol dehydrogenase-13